MLPILFSIGPIKIYSYGFFISLAFLVGSFVVWKRAKEEAYDEEKIFDALVLTVLFALLGARGYFILLNFQNFGFNFLKWIWLTRYAGLCFHGGLLGGILGLFLFTRREKWDFWQTADIAVFGLVLGQAIGRIGCFLNGCCFGVPTGSIFGIRFPKELSPLNAFGIKWSTCIFLYSNILPQYAQCLLYFSHTLCRNSFLVIKSIFTSPI